MKKPYSKLDRAVKRQIKKAIENSSPRMPRRKLTVGKLKRLEVPWNWRDEDALCVKHIKVDVKGKDHIWVPMTALEALHRSAPALYAEDHNNKCVKAAFRNDELELEWTDDLEAALKILIQYTISS